MKMAIGHAKCAGGFVFFCAMFIIWVIGYLIMLGRVAIRGEAAAGV
jgi:hypothetical protein